MQLPVFWRNVNLRHAVMATPFNKMSRSSQYSITKACKAFLTTFDFDMVNLLGGARQSLKRCKFLLPVGGTMTIVDYCHVDVFRAGRLSNM